MKLLKLLSLVTIFSLSLGCGTIQTEDVKAVWLGKVKIEKCTEWRVYPYQEAIVKECATVESNGFTGWGAVDAVFGFFSACLTTGKCW